MQQNYLTLLAEDRNFRVQNKGGGYLDNNGLFRSYATKQEKRFNTFLFRTIRADSLILTNDDFEWYTKN